MSSQIEDERSGEQQMEAEGRGKQTRDPAPAADAHIGRLLERWPRLKALAFVAENAFWLVRLRLGLVRTKWGTHRAIALDESVAYIERVFADYLRYGEQHFHGKVAELGPGDSAGVALLIRKDGGEQVDLIDRFQNYVDEVQQGRIYAALSKRHSLEAFRLGSDWHRLRLRGVTWVFGTSAEKFMAACPADTYDFIVSRAVLEHLAKPLSTLRQMSRSLRPGGLLLHEVDLRDHEHFSRSHDELTWLGFPSWLWRCMTSHSGRPNRVLAHRYRGVLEELRRTDGIQFELFVKSLVGGQEIDPGVPFDAIPTDLRQRAISFVESQRRQFAREFQDVDAADLAVTTVFIVVRKPEVSVSTAAG
jgi:SAM-dependent methyltransferase